MHNSMFLGKPITLLVTQLIHLENGDKNNCSGSQD